MQTYLYRLNGCPWFRLTVPSYWSGPALRLAARRFIAGDPSEGEAGEWVMT
jgi:hypothetical protein